ncbi:DNA repair protein RecO [Candidatus Schneideria nysicola]|uniref:DNA repair protein RecO n=1 Tax=Candidatus Schneideria nysicola TaxID=1081631 RepID=UPI001CAA773C|nr:DNA repair protein RecO [Candidatus Schneideria nysicola]UAJ66120.1 DNA repair protein RecO [Candidatus Schneideria nysicola]
MKEIFQHSFLLHTFPYRESSIFLDCFTNLKGRVRLLAKGVRTNKCSILRGILQPFTPLIIYWKDSSNRYNNIKILSQAESVSIRLPLNGVMLYSGLYINELLNRVLFYDIPYVNLFNKYTQCLSLLASSMDSPEPILRHFEFILLKEIGYGIDFLHCANSGEPIKKTMIYRYCNEKGFVTSLVYDKYSFTGSEIQSMSLREFDKPDILRAAKRFTRIALKPYIGKNPIKSKELFSYFFK